MKNFYTAPSIEVIEVEIEDAILNMSGFDDNGTTGDPAKAYRDPTDITSIFNF